MVSPSQRGGARPWRACGQSVRGANHRRARLPNQDAIRWWRHGATGLPFIQAVADGHGGAKHFRSQRGARLAVKVALRAPRRLLGPDVQALGPRAFRQVMQEQLPRALTRAWTEAVASHLGRYPLARRELARLEQDAGREARRAVEAEPRLAYGATLMAVILTARYVVYCQLGDGDILTVAEDGLVSRPLPHDARLVGNATTSLCAPEAWRDFRVGVQPLEQAPPALILLATDGYANSFRTDRDFLQVGSDLWDLVCEDGFDQVGKRLESWLELTTTAGSGDDITLGLLCRQNAVRAPRPAHLVEPAMPPAEGPVTGVAVPAASPSPVPPAERQPPSAAARPARGLLARLIERGAR